MTPVVVSPDTFWSDVGRAVKARRVELGKRQCDVSVEAGLHDTCVGQMERGTLYREEHSLVRVLKALGLRVVIENEP